MKLSEHPVFEVKARSLLDMYSIWQNQFTPDHPRATICVGTEDESNLILFKGNEGDVHALIEFLKTRKMETK